jgi:phosphate transport system substrate-binding protein
MFTRRTTSESDGIRRRGFGRLGGASVLSVLASAGMVLTASSAGASSLSFHKLESWPADNVQVQETGSSLLYPLFNTWSASIKQAHPSVSVQTASTGSGTGISSAASGTANIGASDAFLSNAQVQQYKGLMNIPLAISAQQVNYNIPGLSIPNGGHLKLSGPVLSAIYQGQITNWNDPKIATLNPGVTVPNVPIVTVHRSDSSGDTFLFTDFLTKADPCGWATMVSTPVGTTVPWPNVPGAVAAQGNGGMVTTCAQTPGCVSYIGISYIDQATQKGLGYAALENKASNFELPTPTTIAAAASSFASKTPKSGAVDMEYGPNPNGYPIVNYEYGIVPSKQPNSSTAKAVKAVLAWSIDPTGGNAPSFLDPVHFVALPTQVTQTSLQLINKVH